MFDFEGQGLIFCQDKGAGEVDEDLLAASDDARTVLFNNGVVVDQVAAVGLPSYRHSHVVIAPVLHKNYTTELKV